MSEAPTDRPYTVVVGVSATSKSPAALAWAATQVKANSGHLVAVRVLKRTDSPTLTGAPPSASDDGSVHQSELAADVAEALGPDHGAECRVLYGGRRRSLLAVADTADLLVIDAARTPSTASLLAHRIISGARCPVVVLPLSLTHEPPWGISRAGRAMGESALRAMGTSGRAGYHPPPERSD